MPKSCLIEVKKIESSPSRFWDSKKIPLIWATNICFYIVYACTIQQHVNSLFSTMNYNSEDPTNAIKFPSKHSIPMLSWMGITKQEEWLFEYNDKKTK